MKDDKALSPADTKFFHSARESQPSDAVSIEIVQQPENGKATPANAKSRGTKWPIEPPPVLELKTQPERNNWLNINSPNWFCTAELVIISSPRARPNTKLNGMLVSSLHKIKDEHTSKKEHGYFIFGNLNIDREGDYRVRFTLFEMRQRKGDMFAVRLQDVTTQSFKVYNSRQVPPVPTMTPLSRILTENGVRLRVRKEVPSRRKTQPTDWSSTKDQAMCSNGTPLGAVGSMGPPQYPPSGKRQKNMGDDISGRVATHHSHSNMILPAPENQMPNHGMMQHQTYTFPFSTSGFPAFQPGHAANWMPPPPQQLRPQPHTITRVHSDFTPLPSGMKPIGTRLAQPQPSPVQGGYDQQISGGTSYGNGDFTSQHSLAPLADSIYTNQYPEQQGPPDMGEMYGQTESDNVRLYNYGMGGNHNDTNDRFYGGS